MSETIAAAERLVADGLVTVEAAASFLSVARSTIYSLMDSGHLPFVKLGRSRRVPRAALIRLAAENLKGTAGGP